MMHTSSELTVRHRSAISRLLHERDDGRLQWKRNFRWHIRYNHDVRLVDAQLQKECNLSSFQVRNFYAAVRLPLSSSYSIA